MMIDKSSDVRIRETVMEETTQAQEPQAQDNIGSEVEPRVQATPEHKSALIAEQRLGGQAQELLLRDQLNSQIPAEDKAAFQNDTRTPTFTRHNKPRETPLSASDMVKETVKQIPDQLSRTLGEIAEGWSHPGEVLSGAAEEAKRKWEDIKAGK